MQYWEVKYSTYAKKQMDKLDNSARTLIENFILRLQSYSNPRSVGKALHGEYAGLWRYSVSKYRIICSIQDKVMTIEILKIGHRKEVYK